MGSNFVSELGRVLIVGGGRMGQAIARGILSIDGFNAENLVIANPSAEKRASIEKELAVATASNAVEAMPAQTLILAVKPAKISEVARSLAECGVSPQSLVISIAAGISTRSLVDALGGHASVVRVMPNTPLVVDCGMSAISGAAGCSQDQVDLAQRLFASMGKAVVVDEELQDVVCAVSGSGPAYFELFAELIAQQATSLGLTYDVALELVMQTMFGTARLVMETGQSLSDAIDAVSSPGGTTVAALDAMRNKGLDQAIRSGVSAAVQRSKELGA